MQLLLKCADLSNVVRPFTLADKARDFLGEEFFRQGSLELASDMEYTSPLKDRASLDKTKSWIGFVSSVCLPLFQAVAKEVSELICNSRQVEANLVAWKEEQQPEVPPPDTTCE
jgi:hypothetical protein